jgi:ATP-binding cassette, subfamily B, bacterial
MKYALNTNTITGERKSGVISVISSLWPLLIIEKKKLSLAFLAIIMNSALTLSVPIIIGHIIDRYIIEKEFHGVLLFSGILFLVYIGALVANYLQTNLMGTVGQRALYNVRNAVFTKIQSLPIAFFNQNKAGDLISRINNDTDKLNQVISQQLVQLVGNVMVMLGAGIFLVSLNPKLGLIALAPAVFVFILTRAISPWVKNRNLNNLKSVGALSAEVQESLNNFKVIVAFNRRDYFRKRFVEANTNTYNAATKAGIANNIFTPVYGLSSNIAQLLVLSFGIYFITNGFLTLGLLIGFLAYVNNFYNPLQQLAVSWASFQVAMAGWDRISAILKMENDLVYIQGASHVNIETDLVLSFEDVDFSYPDGASVLHGVNLSLEKGKTYALVGPTGGGKTTTASLMARLYDPTKGTVLLFGKDIRTYTSDELTKKIGFILQEPFLFGGTLKDNILYGNTEYESFDNKQIIALLEKSGLEDLLPLFDQGLETPVSIGGESISLGQRQIIAFIRAVLRRPDILILDEATANIDTVTEEILQKILDKLPKETTLIVIAHRLHTIAKADEIFFVNGGEVVNAGSMDQAINMLMNGSKKS